MCALISLSLSLSNRLLRKASESALLRHGLEARNEDEHWATQQEKSRFSLSSLSTTYYKLPAVGGGGGGDGGSGSGGSLERHSIASSGNGFGERKRESEE